MRFGNAAWGFRETPLEKQFEITRNMGLDILEVGIANAPDDIPLDVSEERIAEIIRCTLTKSHRPSCITGRAIFL